MKPKYLLLLATVFAFSAGAYADKLDSDGILRSDDGSIRYINQYEAMKACPEGTHLPTIRELAKLSQASSAKGILEVGQVDPNGVPAGYDKISAINPDGQKDEFYFNYEGYKRPSGSLGRNWFWSSSVYSLNSDVAYGLRGHLGFVGSVAYRHFGYYFGSAVRCVVDQ